MGFFSWKTQDTNRSIPSIYSNRAPFTVYMADNAGNVWPESEYEGYGVFGGKDFYELLAEMNGVKCDDIEESRAAGIGLAFGSKAYLSPMLTEEPAEYNPHDYPENCPDQGFFYE